ncbi:MAG: hemerythrin domain-containing protein [Saccharofermentanales bacterium]
MKYACDDLRNEHDGIQFGLKILKKMTTMFQDAQNGDVEDFEEIVNFFRIYADKCHHGKEETMLFPAMIDAGIDRKIDIIDQLISEHQTSRKYLAQMAEAITGGLVNQLTLISSADDYIELLHRHIEKENVELFPLGDTMIPMKIQEELLEKFEKFEENVMGKGMHMKLHDILNKLEDKYFSVKD